MKLISLIILGVCLFQFADAQKTVEVNKDLSAYSQVKLDFQFADSIQVKSWDKNQLYVKAVVSINGGKNNDNFSFNIKPKENLMVVESKIKDLDKMSKSRKVQDVETGEIFETDCHVSLDLYYEVYVPATMNLSLETINGNISCSGLTGRQKLHTISGDIDYFCPKNRKTDLELSTISGGMYSNLDLKSDMDDDYHHFGMHNFSYKLNGGGLKTELETISGDIYLRKAE